MTEIKLKIEGMHCISCVSSIEEALAGLRGVKDIKVDFATSLAYVEFDEATVDEEAIMKRVSHAGYHADLLGHEMHETSSAIPTLFQDPSFLSFLIAALLTIPLMFNMIGSLFGIGLTLSPLMQLLFASIVQFWSGRSFYRGAYYSLKARVPNMDLLIAIGTSAAYFYSLLLILFDQDNHLYFDTSAAIITIVLLGRWIEGSTKHRATMAIQKLMALRPKMVQVERDGQLIEVEIDQVSVGDIFFVRPHENVAVDGKVLFGDSAVDESFLTGESIPVSKGVGDLVYAGTTNGSALLKAEALRVGDETTLASIVKLVEKLHLSKAPIQRLADQVSATFVPLVLLVSLITLFSWWFFSGSLTQGVLSAVATLVIACPCALGIATPLVILIASGKGADLGLIFQDAIAIERASKVDTLILDKTGTLTVGQPKVSQVMVFNGIDEDEAIRIVGSMSQFSTHPLSKSVSAYADLKGIEREPLTALESFPGKGIRAVKRGVLYELGSLTFAEENGCLIPGEILRQNGGSEVLLWSQKRVLAAIFIQDPLRKNSKEVVEKLKERGIDLYLISGDRRSNVEAVARAVGIDKFRFGVLPDKKAEVVVELKKRDKVLGMCGDGINDAPALAAADIGFSLGSGSDIAISASDVTLIHNDLMGLVDAMELSCESIKKIKQNLVLAFAYNTVAIPIAAMGWLNPIIAALAMALSSISVVFNSLLLQKWLPTSKRH